ncbi:hypothetical protein B9Z55_027166 [Caenorhabditis nigoni]|uniref:Uncharacterized protein n=1 Tax=Caenorhabditis nigoni TaxID=1611254 RepID=A0A2G5SGD0_9PELO|nr:hypothetical protein B9Z55_027166 [Caenorhabditis nigoni]
MAVERRCVESTFNYRDVMEQLNLYVTYSMKLEQGNFLKRGNQESPRLYQAGTLPNRSQPPNLRSGGHGNGL